ncbi:hypothetical protein ABZT03_16900, partial [Streptomyces sp. NPDC005574]|uniref:hypothetical protein n=1 Tax=Streptomyces sp. NPDC005574 TaxID=3156891 RepID=UPI0033BAD32E
MPLRPALGRRCDRPARAAATGLGGATTTGPRLPLRPAWGRHYDRPPPAATTGLYGLRPWIEQSYKQ